MNIEQVNVELLIPYEQNAKKHGKKQIANVAESIRRFGFVQPVVIDADNVIVIGHCRVLAAKMLGMESVPCVHVDELTPEDVNALRIVDNKTNESDWDMDALLAELPEIDLTGFDLEFGGGKDKSESEPGEVEFSEELLLTHNYIVLYFDNDFDWSVAQDRFGLKETKDLIPRKSQPTGIGRVVDGKKVLEWQS